MAAQIVQSHVDSDSSQQKDRPYQREAHKNGDVQPLVPPAAHSTVRKHKGERTTAGWDQNPELLQWRANVLLDEMMLGAVDIAANETTPPLSAPTRSARTASVVDYPATEPAPERRVAPGAGYANGAQQQAEPSPDTAPDTAVEELPTSSEPQDEWARPAWHFADPAPAPAQPPSSTATPAARAAVLQEHTRYHHTPPVTPTPPTERPHPARQSTATPDIRTSAIGAPPARSAPPSPAPSVSAPAKPEQWVFAAEQRYQQIAARHSAPLPESGVPSVGRSGGASGATQEWASATDAYFDEFAANAYGYANGSATGQAAMRRPGVNQSIRRSNLLPRISSLDPRALQQEMAMLQTEIEQALPAGHESRVRALHLLQKAYTILQADPSRSAEVDYYLQQVRTIGQRVQETLHWSNLYHSRLRVYLSAWSVLSVIVIGACYFYQRALAEFIVGLSGAAAGTESLLAHNLLTIFTTFFAGSLGGAVGAFMNMRQYAHVKQGFFDRKYSLRGLILPLIGGLAGLVLCLFFGVIYYLFGADPATNLLLGLLPACLAFAFGVAQEFIYGTHS